jgi:flagellar basal-body rod modification protein FlgD
MNHISALAQTETQKDTPKSNPTQSLGKDDFLTLLVTQLQNQDPLKPMDPTEFTSQLAQFSSLEQLNNINENLQALHSIQDGFDRLAALSMIGTYVIAESETFKFHGEAMDIGFRFNEKIKDATVYITTAEGQTVGDIKVANRSAGEHFVWWDGKDQNGQKLPEGTYSLRIVGTTDEGDPISGLSLVKSQISGVDFSAPETILMTTNGPVKLSEISKVNKLTISDSND